MTSIEAATTELAVAKRLVAVDPKVVECFDKTGFDLSELPPLCSAEELAAAIHTTVSALAQDRYLKRGILLEVRKVFIIAPGDVISGGPEACHQLADVLNRDCERAFIVYTPLGRRHDVPAAYRKYRVRPVILEDVEPGSIVVLPESAAPMALWWPASSIYFWWFSVDGFAIAANMRGNDPETEFMMIKPHVTKHLFASDYARCYLKSKGVTGSHLADPLAEEYLAIAGLPTFPHRRNLVAYNPRRGGMERTQRVLDELGRKSWAPETVAIMNMAPHQVKTLLSQAKVCVDFSDHPGKDRLPREAAACGAGVLVNRRGGAANPVDVPIPEEFKLDDAAPDFARRAVDKIEMFLDGFGEQQPRFEDYRKQIARESDNFIEDIGGIFPPGP